MSLLQPIIVNYVFKNFNHVEGTQICQHCDAFKFEKLAPTLPGQLLSREKENSVQVAQMRRRMYDRNQWKAGDTWDHTDGTGCAIGTGCAVGTRWFWQNFIISMCVIKFWKGNEKLRSVKKKPFFKILSSSFHFFHSFIFDLFKFPSTRWELNFFD